LSKINEAGFIKALDVAYLPATCTAVSTNTLIFIIVLLFESSLQNEQAFKSYDQIFNTVLKSGISVYRGNIERFE